MFTLPLATIALPLGTALAAPICALMLLAFLLPALCMGLVATLRDRGYLGRVPELSTEYRIARDGRSYLYDSCTRGITWGRKGESELSLRARA